jgi:hypothetical protein
MVPETWFDLPDAKSVSRSWRQILMLPYFFLNLSLNVKLKLTHVSFKPLFVFGTHWRTIFRPFDAFGHTGGEHHAGGFWIKGILSDLKYG